MDDGRLGDDMTLDGIAKQLGELSTKIDDVDRKVSTLDRKVSTLDTKVSTLDTKVSTLDTKVSTLDNKVDRLDGNMKIEFEETRRLNKLGFESVTILEEQIGRRFDRADRTHDEHKKLLEAAVEGLYKRRAR